MKDLKCYLCGNSKLVAFVFNSVGNHESVELVCMHCRLVVYNINGHAEAVQIIPPKKYLKPIDDIPTLNKLRCAEDTIRMLRNYQEELHEIIRNLKKGKN
jgi:hypothetical protein